MRGTVAKKIRKIAMVVANGDEALEKFYYKQAKKVHKKVLRAK